MADLAAILRAAGCDVAEIPGWRTRRRPGEWAVCGIVLHHTAGTKSLDIIIAGRADLPGPLANLHIPKAGPVNLVAATRCNHAGPGSQVVLDGVRQDIAPRGDALARGLIDGPSGNAFFYGLECENRGDGSDPWPPAQLEVIAHAAAAICAHHGWTANRVIAHREWTRRKPDPRGFVMADMRKRIASLLAKTASQEDEDMAFTDIDSAHLRDTKNYMALLGEHQNPRIIELLEAILERLVAKGAP